MQKNNKQNIITSYNNANNSKKISDIGCDFTERNFEFEYCGKNYKSRVLEALEMEHAICNRHKSYISLIIITIGILLKDNNIEDYLEKQVGKYKYDIIIPKHKLIIEYDSQKSHKNL